MPRNALLFGLVVLVQLAVPAWMIREHERVRNEGELFKFRTAPVDPRDPFRGEYVRLDFVAANGRWALPGTQKADGSRHSAAAVIATDSAGFATIASVSQERPESGSYITVEYTAWDVDSLYGINLPFDRYYLEEGEGPKTEQLLTPQWTDGVPSEPLPAYALVRVLDGRAVIEDLVVADRSIHVWLQEMAAEQQ